MIKKSFLLGAIVSIITTNAIANQVITSQTYVDNADAQKVNIAQGVGTNNANVGKTLVVNSSGNLVLGTPSAGNYVEDSITDGVTTKAPSENAVHDALADKQDIIPAKATASEYSSASLVEATGTPGTVGERKIWDALVDWDNDEEGDDSFVNAVDGNGSEEGGYIPTVGAVMDAIDVASIRLREEIELSKQSKIPESGYVKSGNDNYSIGASNWTSGMWLYNNIKGTGLVTKTDTRGNVGERKIIETADVANYGTGTATQQQVQEISIPTMGAVMAAISNNTPTLPTGTANTVVMYNNSGAIGGSRAIYDGSATYNATNDATKLVTANGVSKMKECTRWIDNAAHTDENCLLWRLS